MSGFSQAIFKNNFIRLVKGSLYANPLCLVGQYHIDLNYRTSDSSITQNLISFHSGDHRDYVWIATKDRINRHDGFDVGREQERTIFGLRSIKKHPKMVGGSLKIESEAGQARNIQLNIKVWA